MPSAVEKSLKYWKTFLEIFFHVFEVVIEALKAGLGPGQGQGRCTANNSHPPTQSLTLRFTSLIGEEEGAAGEGALCIIRSQTLGSLRWSAASLRDEMRCREWREVLHSLIIYVHLPESSLFVPSTCVWCVIFEILAIRITDYWQIKGRRWGMLLDTTEILTHFNSSFLRGVWHPSNFFFFF